MTHDASNAAGDEVALEVGDVIDVAWEQMRATASQDQSSEARAR
jgi:hypothetical protein